MVTSNFPRFLIGRVQESTMFTLHTCTNKMFVFQREFIKRFFKHLLLDESKEKEKISFCVQVLVPGTRKSRILRILAKLEYI
jgi:hypothetical protein